MSQYYMMDSWGLDFDEPVLKPVDFEYDEWEEDYGLNNLLVSFIDGTALKHLNIPEPIELEWKDKTAGGGMAWEMEGVESKGPRNGKGIRMKWVYSASEPVLYHKDVVVALQESGVDNLETYQTKITNKKTGEVCEDYLAVNIVGLVKAADMLKSKAVVHSANGLIDTDFDSIVINEDAAAGHKMFRLAESINGVVIHRSVKEHLESKGGFELTFAEPEDWIG